MLYYFIEIKSLIYTIFLIVATRRVSPSTSENRGREKKDGAEQRGIRERIEMHFLLTAMFSLGAKLYNLAVGKKRSAPEVEEDPQTSAVRAKIVHRSPLSSDEMLDLPTVPVPATTEPVGEEVAPEAAPEENAPSEDAPPSQEDSDEDERTPGISALDLQTLKECYANGTIPSILSGDVEPAIAVDEDINDKVIVWSVRPLRLLNSSLIRFSGEVISLNYRSTLS